MAAKFENVLISPDFPINFRKSHQISKNYLKRSKSYGQKPLGALIDPLAWIGLNLVVNSATVILLIEFIVFLCEKMECLEKVNSHTSVW